jgi:hypothetical protein
MGAVEAALRADAELTVRLKRIISKRDAGLHSLGDIWRRHRVSCPTREELGTWLLDSLGPEEEDYVRFHLEVVGCRLCKANLNDLKQKERESKREVTVRRQRVYQSSAGYLPGERRS